MVSRKLLKEQGQIGIPEHEGENVEFIFFLLQSKRLNIFRL